jgi:manganese transport protein
VIIFLSDPFQGLIWSQIALSIQLPWTIFALIALTSSSKVMGKFASPPSHRRSLWTIAVVVSALNVLLLFQMLR